MNRYKVTIKFDVLIDGESKDEAKLNVRSFFNNAFDQIYIDAFDNDPCFDDCEIIKAEKI